MGIKEVEMEGMGVVACTPEETCYAVVELRPDGPVLAAKIGFVPPEMIAKMSPMPLAVWDHVFKNPGIRVQHLHQWCKDSGVVN